jgi:NitT/TauT family transport system substrate-binding protein
MASSTGLRFVTLVSFLAALVAALAFPGATTAVRAQETGSLSCEPSSAPVQASPAAPVELPAYELPADAIAVKMGFVNNAAIYAPIYIAKEKGYFAEQGLDVSLESQPNGSDMVALTATGDFDIGFGGVGPAFWNAMDLGLPLKVIAPGHAEGNPVATPLMISKAACESGAIKSVADLKGKKVSVNGRGATEYWLSQALGTAGLTLADIELQTLQFPDAVAALQAGALDAAMVGEPVATSAEQQGIAVRLLTDFPVQDIQPTAVYANQSFLDENPEAAAGFVTAYLKAAREVNANGFKDPTIAAIIEQYTGVPVALISQAVSPVYAVDGQIDLKGLQTLQAFFRAQGQLEYETDIDPASFVDTQYVAAALQELGDA